MHFQQGLFIYNALKLDDSNKFSGNLNDKFCQHIFYRKKKMTAHWRNFIRPLMWRCKWTELRIKEIESQASKYSKELAEYEQVKHPGMDVHASDSLCSKSLPYSGQCYNKRTIKRRKRKKIEETTDISSYMSSHNLFSYLGMAVFSCNPCFPFLSHPPLY